MWAKEEGRFLLYSLGWLTSVGVRQLGYTNHKARK